MKKNSFFILFLASLILSCSRDDIAAETSEKGAFETINGLPISDKAAIEESIQKNRAAGKSTMMVVIRKPDGSKKSVEILSPLAFQ